MLHIAINYHDPNVLLRLGALIAMIIIIACLGVFEFVRPMNTRMKLVFWAILLIACLMGGYALVQLRGA